MKQALFEVGLGFAPGHPEMSFDLNVVFLLSHLKQWTIQAVLLAQSHNLCCKVCNCCFLAAVSIPSLSDYSMKRTLLVLAMLTKLFLDLPLLPPELSDNCL